MSGKIISLFLRVMGLYELAQAIQEEKQKALTVS